MHLADKWVGICIGYFPYSSKNNWSSAEEAPSSLLGHPRLFLSWLLATYTTLVPFPQTPSLPADPPAGMGRSWLKAFAQATAMGTQISAGSLLHFLQVIAKWRSHPHWGYSWFLFWILPPHPSSTFYPSLLLIVPATIQHITLLFVSSPLHYMVSSMRGPNQFLSFIHCCFPVPRTVPGPHWMLKRHSLNKWYPFVHELSFTLSFLFFAFLVPICPSWGRNKHHLPLETCPHLLQLEWQPCHRIHQS